MTDHPAGLEAGVEADRQTGLMAAALAIGTAVPELRLEDARGREKALSSLRGRPVVVAFSPGWNSALAPRLDDELRGELRGLGTVLLVVARDGIWLHQADDPVERYDLSRASGASLGAVHHAFGVAPLGTALFVIDTQGQVRWRGAGPAGDAVQAVLSALHSAGVAMRATPPNRPLMLGRRELLVSTLAAAFAFYLGGCERRGETPAPAATPPVIKPPVDSDTVAVRLNINGEEKVLQLEPRVTLLDTLRERLGLTGTKKGCDHGQCGACTVLVDGQRLNSCLTLAIMQQGKKITTIEGLAHGEQLHPLQAAFIEHDAFQCGYCTPGQIMSAVSLLSQGGTHTADQIREQMSGNLCRCGAYNNIVAAILAVQGKG